MYFDFGLRSSVLLIFFVHGLVYAMLLFRKGFINSTVADKWLSAFLLLCVLYITPWMLGFAGWYDNQPYRDILFYTPFQHLFLIGPVIYFYVQSLLNPSFTFTKKQLVHFIPGVLYALYCVMMVLVDKVVLKRYYFLADGFDRDFDAWYQWCGFAAMLFYFFMAMRFYNMYKKLMLQVISYADVVMFKWVSNFLMSFLTMQVLQVVFFILSKTNPVFTTYIGSWWYFFMFAIIFYYVAIMGYSNAIATKIPFKINQLQFNKPLLLNNSFEQHLLNDTPIIEETEAIEINPFETVAAIDQQLINEWKPKIEHLLITDKIYEDPELSLKQMASLLKTNASIVSKVINQGFAMNFNDLINYYRIQAVKNKLQAGEQKLQTLLGIAYVCGFNSKATFNRAFKKFTGVGPKDWSSQI